MQITIITMWGLTSTTFWVTPCMNNSVMYVIHIYSMIMEVFRKMYCNCLKLIDNKVLLVRFTADDRQGYMIPLLRLKFHTQSGGHGVYPTTGMFDFVCYAPIFMTSRERSMIMDYSYSYFALNGCVEHMLSKNTSYDDLTAMIKPWRVRLKKKAEDKKYIYAEVGDVNVTRAFKKVAWSLLSSKITVAEFKYMLQFNRTSEVLYLTDANTLDVIVFTNNDEILFS